jgi:hypothetical protein
MRAEAATIAAINDYRQGAGSGRLDGVRTRGAGHILLALAPAAREIDFFCANTAHRSGVAGGIVTLLSCFNPAPLSRSQRFTGPTRK